MLPTAINPSLPASPAAETHFGRKRWRSKGYFPLHIHPETGQLDTNRKTISFTYIEQGTNDYRNRLLALERQFNRRCEAAEREKDKGKRTQLEREAKKFKKQMNRVNAEFERFRKLAVDALMANVTLELSQAGSSEVKPEEGLSYLVSPPQREKSKKPRDISLFIDPATGKLDTNPKMDSKTYGACLYMYWQRQSRYSKEAAALLKQAKEARSIATIKTLLYEAGMKYADAMKLRIKERKFKRLVKVDK